MERVKLKPQLSKGGRELVPQPGGRGAITKGPGPGRPKGSPNKIGAQLKELFIQAANNVGAFTIETVPIRDRKTDKIIGTREVRKNGYGGALAFLEWCAKYETRSFLAQFGRIIPMQFVGHDDGAIEVVYRSAKEVKDELERRGIPTETMLLLTDQRRKPGESVN